MTRSGCTGKVWPTLAKRAPTLKKRPNMPKRISARPNLSIALCSPNPNPQPNNHYASTRNCGRRDDVLIWRGAFRPCRIADQQDHGRFAGRYDSGLYSDDKHPNLWHVFVDRQPDCRFRHCRGIGSFDPDAVCACDSAMGARLGYLHDRWAAGFEQYIKMHVLLGRGNPDWFSGPDHD